MKNIWIVSVVFVLTAGCSSKAVYQDIQRNNRQDLSRFL